MNQLYSLIKPINGFSGYFISTNGNVYSRINKGDRRDINGVQYKSSHKISQRLTKNGYARVYLREDATGKRKDLYIHRIVAEHFINNPENLKYVNHKNCIRNDNKVSNLEWISAKDNTDQTLALNHIYRDNYGRYASNFKYENKIV